MPRESGRTRPVPTNDLSISGKPAWWFEEIAQEKNVMQNERRERAEARVVVHIEEDEERSRRCRYLKVQLELEVQERKDLLEQVKRMEETERSRYRLLHKIVAVLIVTNSKTIKKSTPFLIGFIA